MNKDAFKIRSYFVGKPYTRELFNYALFKVRQKQVAEDLVQEIFLGMSTSYPVLTLAYRVKMITFQQVKDCSERATFNINIKKLLK